MTSRAQPVGARSARVDRVVVHAAGDAAAGARIAQRLPAALDAALARRAPQDERALRRIVEHAVREAAR